MLYYLLVPLRDELALGNLMRYITFRAAGSAVTALLICLLLGPLFIRKLRQLQIGEEIRNDGPKTHLSKAGTPSMGGILLLLSVVVPMLLFARIAETYVWLIIVVTVYLSALGFLDDYLKIVKKYPKGLIGKYKLAGQVMIGLLVGCIIYFFPEVESARASTTIPFLKNYELNFGIFYIPIVVFIITAMSNGSNLTDGQDGLLLGLSAIAAIAFAGIAYVSGRVDFSNYLNIIYLPHAGELAIYCSCLFGASLGMLFWNAYPAQVFLGDTGALMIGGGIATVAIMVKKELLLPLICFIFLLESLSVIVQVFWYKRTGKRVLLMAPIHHHWEIAGIAEPKIVTRFWIAGILLALLAFTTFKIR